LVAGTKFPPLLQVPTSFFSGQGTLLCYFLENLKKETTKIDSVSVAV